MTWNPAAACVLACLAVIFACAPSDTETAADTADASPAPAAERPDGSGLRGFELLDPIEVPPFTFTDTEGQPYDFLERTSGTLSFVFFGFTHCPDVCPVQLANLAAALGDLGYADRRRIEVIFVSTDPERDTPDVIREYLNRFDHEFTGLTAPIDEVNELLAALGLPPAVKEPVEGTDDYMVGHVAQIMAVTGDGRVRVAYPGGVRQNDWRADLPALLRLNASFSSSRGG